MSLTEVWHGWLTSATVERLGWSLLHFVWQGAVIAGGLSLLLRWLRHGSPQARYGAACGALALMACCPLVTWMICDSSRHGLHPRVPQISQSLPLDPPGSTVTLSNSAELVDAGRAGDAGVADSTRLAPSLPDAASSPGAPAVAKVAVEPAERIVSFEPVPGSAGERDEARQWVWLRQGLPAMVAAWLGGVFLLSLRLAWIWFRVQQLRTRYVQPASDEVREVLKRLVERLQVRRAVTLVESALVEVPTVLGWMRPVILLPLTATTGLSEEQLVAILAHELAHIRRADYLVNMVQSIVETLLFYHPAVWWVGARMRQEREHCCDDLASALCGDPRSYAAALLKMEELRGTSAQIALAARGGDLLARVRRLAGKPAPERLLPWWWSLGLASAVLLVAAGGLWSWIEPAPAEATVMAEALAGPNPSDDRPWTLPQILQEIQRAQEAFRTCEYAVSYYEVRDARALQGRPPLLVAGDGQYRYRTAGGRWWADEQGWTLDLNSGERLPRHSTSGFDGRDYFSREEQRLVRGENALTDRRLDPRAVFWHGARSAEGLLHALRSPEARVARQESIDNHACQVIEVEVGKPSQAAANPAGAEWKYEVALAPTAGWLPLRTRLFRQGQLWASERLQDVQRAPSGAMYPRRIEFQQESGRELVVRREVQIEQLSVGTPLDDSAFRQEPRWGDDVVDRRTGRAWHHDPWWTEVVTWLGQSTPWPPRERITRTLQSYADRPFDGRAAPALEGVQWVRGTWNGWERADRRATIVVFVGGDAISPTPQWLNEVRALVEQYAAGGVEAVAITDASADRQVVQRLGEMLDWPFPLGIDQPAATKGSAGKVHEACGLSSYAGVVVVDDQRRLRLIDLATASATPDPSGAAATPRRLEELLEAALTDEGRRRCQRQARETLARQLAFDMTGRVADPTLLAAALDDTSDRWLSSYGSVLWNSLTADERAWHTERQLTLDSLVAGAVTSQSELTGASARRLEEQWRRWRSERAGQAVVRGEVLVSSQPRHLFLAPHPQLTVAGVQARVTLVPVLQLLNSATPGGYFLAVDSAGKVEVDTDDRGRFSLGKLRKGTYRLTVAAPGLAREERLLHLPQDDAVGEIAVPLHQGDTLAGVVVDGAGQGVPGAQVKLVRRHTDPQSPRRTTTAHLPTEPRRTDASGRFAFDRLYSGAYTVEASAPGFVAQTLEWQPAGSPAVRVVMRREGESPVTAPPTGDSPSNTSADTASADYVYVSKVEDNSSGEPVVGARVRWRLERVGRDGRPAVAWQGEFVSDAQGQYRVQLPRDLVSLPRKIVWLEVSHRDYLPIRGTGYPLFRPDEDVGNQIDHRRLKLQRGREITGQVRLPDGRPAVDVPLMVARDREGFGDGDGLGFQTRTDREGRFRLLTRAEWPQRLHWFPDDYASDSRAVTREFGDQGTIKLKPGWRLRGQVVTVDGQPLAGLVIQAASGTRIPLTYATSNAQGEFVFSPLPAGTYRLSPMEAYCDQRAGEWRRGRVSPPFTGIDVVLGPDTAAAPVVLRAAAAVKLVARVVDGRGEPVEGRRLIAGYEPAVRYSTPLTGEPGRYEIELASELPLSPIRLEHSFEESASYRLATASQAFPGPGIRVREYQHGRAELLVQVVPASTIRYRVRTADGEALPNDLSVDVRYQREEEYARAEMVTSGLATSSGGPEPEWHVVVGIAPGEPVEFSVTAPGYQPFRQRMVVASGQTGQLEIVLRRATATRP
ncbi:MAG: M56 family metallopeptidase [Pirellulales bacterium]